MQSILLPAKVSEEATRETLLMVAWTLLEKHTLNWTTFVEMIAQNAPNHGGAGLFSDALQQSLQREMVGLARALVERGLVSYPKDDPLLKARKALASPKVLRTGQRAGRDYSQSMHWLSEHSHEYQTQWVALRDGVFLGAAPSRQDLIEQVGDIEREPNVIFSRIPST